MIEVNDHYQKLHASYLFSEIARRVEMFEQTHPESNVIKMGIGDVTKALPAACISAFHLAVDEMGVDATFRGYGPEQGYEFLREAVAKDDYQSRGADIHADDIFISDGAKCDAANIQELFGPEVVVAVQDPVYPVYVDTNVMAGRTGGWSDGRYDQLVYLDSNEENGFFPDPPDQQLDLIYLCSPNNPTGSVATRRQLQRWVDYALGAKALLLFDGAYSTYIRDDNFAHSIYEIPRAREVAIEFRSFSKSAGFTGTRCAYTVVPAACRGFTADGDATSLRELWKRRQTTKFNGVSYPVQRAAEAVYSEEGQNQVRDLANYYLENASVIRTAMKHAGFTTSGGVHSPFIWVRTNTDSWEFFERLLEEAEVVCTPGSGFGRCGAGYVRLSAFNDRGAVDEAMSRIKTIL